MNLSGKGRELVAVERDRGDIDLERRDEWERGKKGEP